MGKKLVIVAKLEHGRRNAERLGWLIDYRMITPTWLDPLDRQTIFSRYLPRL